MKTAAHQIHPRYYHLTIFMVINEPSPWRPRLRSFVSTYGCLVFVSLSHDTNSSSGGWGGGLSACARWELNGSVAEQGTEHHVPEKMSPNTPLSDLFCASIVDTESGLNLLVLFVSV